jgi:hypothetical protein
VKESAVLRSVLTTLAELAGLTLVSVGFGVIWWPLGVICAGVALILLGAAAA